jgi:predicted DNA-binding transcriptional regulator AlpA
LIHGDLYMPQEIKMIEHNVVRLLRPKMVADRLGISTSGLWLLVKNGTLRAPHRPAAMRASVWLESDIETFILEQIRGRSRTPEQTQPRRKVAAASAA